MTGEGVRTDRADADAASPDAERARRGGVTGAVLRFLQWFATNPESPLSDLRTALGHIRPALVLWGALAIALVTYVSTGVYSVAPGEAAVVRRFGEIILPRVEPGLHYRMPWPIDQVDIVNVSNIRREQVGVVLPEEEHLHPEPLSKMQTLSGDTNVVDVEVIVQYQVRSPADYLFNIRYAPYRIVRDTLRAAVTRRVTNLPVDALLTSGRQSLQEAIREETQRQLDEYRSGLVIVGIDLQKAFPPADVADAFTAVNTAREERARVINEARGYANSLIPEARGQAQQIKADAEAYRSDVLARANGGADAFQSVLSEYRRNAAANGADVTRYRMYLETIEKIMPRVQVYTVDTSRGGKFNLRLSGDAAKNAPSIRRNQR
ncbi:FtsH protease activity modulator HflK [Rhizobium sp. AN80A]|uniref:FtsH protease activity modulator HflK n=1 Tax=Rhizobium sp. AN80A TaxID=3040673 RepID=UPI0024B371A3|nr:FtsH protease activity modulator HflK [Rhizobium sp. AN80A]